jgi:hypothetical protein
MVSFEIEPLGLQRAAKVNGHGQAKALTVAELGRLFDCFESERDRALFGIYFFSRKVNLGSGRKSNPVVQKGLALCIPCILPFATLPTRRQSIT